MEYEEGTILKLKNIKFKGTNKLDFRMNGHPVVVPIYTGYNDDIFYFTSSSKVNHYATEKDRYYLTGNLPKCGLPLTCIIDLKHVYRAVNANFLPKVPLPSQELKKLINKALDYDSKNLESFPHKRG